jgi:hypothetical protein
LELSEIVAIIEKEPVSLFYGAGVSMACGGPSGTHLLSAVKSKFGDSKADSLLKYMDDFIEDDESNRPKVESYLKEKLALISPENSHGYFFSLPWKAMLTTNYDHLPDAVIETLDRNRSIITISDPTEASIDRSKRNILYCFKLMGDVNYNFPNGGWPVLTHRDMGLSNSRRSKFITLFRNLSSTGHMVYIGYSFKDNLVFDVLHEMKYLLGEIPWKGFAIMPNEPGQKTKEKLQRYGIEWVRGTLDEFIMESKKRFGEKPASAPSLVKGFSIHSIALELERATAANIQGKYDILSDADLNPIFDNPMDFFEGIESKSFYPFTQCWDYPRKVKLVYRNPKNQKLADIEFKDLLKLSKSGNPSDNIVMTLTGSAGSGKSIIAKRLAFDWYRYGNPVIFLNT